MRVSRVGACLNCEVLLHISANHVSTEEAATDFVCVYNKVRHVVICGHSDCKAMNAVYEHLSEPEKIDFTAPIHAWLRKECVKTTEKFKKRVASATTPLVFCEDIPELRFEALIDLEGQLSGGDKMSKVGDKETLVFTLAMLLRANNVVIQQRPIDYQRF